MKKHILFPALAILISLVACSYQHPANAQGGTYTIPAAGTIVAASSMPVTEDALNHYVYTIRVKANSNSKYGTYDVDATWGNNEAKGAFTMPRGGEHLKPLVRKGPGKYTYIIGFNYGSDKTFYDYYQVSAEKGQIEMKYIRAYSFK